MAAYPTYQVQDVAKVTGRDETDIDDFIVEALIQATLLFKLGTCLDEFPDATNDAALARYAILFMADAIESVQPYQEVLRNPFSSENIGSYSYAKLNRAVAAGLPTGVSWFDMAVSQLSVCHTKEGLPSSGGWNVFEENKVAHGGYGVYLGPGDQNPDTWGPDTHTAEQF